MIRFVVALAPEADPIVRHYRMEAVEGAYRWYRTEETALVISGVGKLAAAAAASYLHAKTDETPHAVWLNVGTAGHRERRVGELLIAHTVTEASTGERFHPVRIGGPRLEAVEVRTVDRPALQLEDDVCYDMEAYGLFRSALRFSTAELVQCLKVVSDNRETPASEWKPAKVRDLVEASLENVARAAAHFRELSLELRGAGREREIAAWMAALRRRRRLTASEARKLGRLLIRWAALEPERDDPPAELHEAGETSEMIRRLESRLDALALERPC